MPTILPTLNIHPNFCWCHWSHCTMATRSKFTLTLRRARVSTTRSRIAPLRSLTPARWQSTATTEDSEGVAKGTTGSSKTIKFTSETYPEIKRDPKYSRISEDHVKFFKGLLGKKS